MEEVSGPSLIKLTSIYKRDQGINQGHLKQCPVLFTSSLKDETFLYPCSHAPRQVSHFLIPIAVNNFYFTFKTPRNYL